MAAMPCCSSRVAKAKLKKNGQPGVSAHVSFQNLEVPLFLISLKAGGSGLNLTAADTVILYDPWWNPSVEAQAMDRAHRIGQEKPVFVYRLLTVGTVEERMNQLQERKRELVQALLDDGASRSFHLQPEDIDLLFSPIQ
jgi:SNF2 family DNA or RNA helicase